MYNLHALFYVILLHTLHVCLTVATLNGRWTCFISALLDYVIMESKFVRHPSVVRRSVRVAIISESNVRHFFQILVFVFPCGIRFFKGNFWKKKWWDFYYLRIFFVFVNTWDPMGAKISKTLLLQIATECFQTSPEFSSEWFSQTTVRLGLLKFSKHYSFYKSQRKVFNTCPEFSS